MKINKRKWKRKIENRKSITKRCPQDTNKNKKKEKMNEILISPGEHIRWKIIEMKGGCNPMILYLLPLHNLYCGASDLWMAGLKFNDDRSYKSSHPEHTDRL